VFFLLVSGGLAYAFLQVPEENVPSSTNPLHIHATFAVFVRGERVNFSGPEFDLSTRGFLISHLHSPDQDLLHLEGQRGQRFSDALARATGTQFDATFVSVDAPVAVRYDAAPGEKVRLFVAAHGEEEWREVENLLGYVPLDQDRILLTLGAVDSAGLAAQQGAVKAGAATLAQRAPWAGRDGRKKWDREGVSDRGHAGAVNDDLVEEVERREGGAAACGNDIHGKEVELRDLVVHENQSLATHPGNGMRVLQ
jgi:hypothetical protein